ncbi:MAG: lipoate--protein ligase family protein [Firmicutes bacterium]|nr:lipoate--protein ligase family protein [Bacillota bacterium]
MIDGGNTGARNMAVDEAIAVAHSRGHVPPTLRLYEWNPPAVSIGYFQDLSKEIDLEACRGLGVDWVRRPTGGRAVLHEDEVTYSVVISERLLPGSVLETYLELSRGLVAALRLLGADPQLAQGALPGGGRGASPACFDSPAWYEMTCGGKKVVGSAQTRRNGVILQHGSIPVYMDARRVVSVLRLDSDDLRRRLEKNLAQKAVGLQQVLGRAVARDEVMDAVQKGFAAGLGLEFERGGLTAFEVELAVNLEREKYSRSAWNEQRQGRGQHV